MYRQSAAFIRPAPCRVAVATSGELKATLDQKRQIVAQFRQNSLLRLALATMEVVFNALPGKVFSGKLAAISPAVPGGFVQSTGTLQTLNIALGSDGVIATIIELDEHTDLSALPDGIYARCMLTLIILCCMS